MVTRSCKLNAHTPILIHRIQDLAILNGNVTFKHTQRGRNMCVDWLTNFNFNQTSYDVRILKTLLRSSKIFFLMTYPKLICQEYRVTL